MSEETGAHVMPPEPELKRTLAEKFIMWYLVVSSLALAAIIVIVALLVSANSRNIASQKKSDIQQCQASNVSREQDEIIWSGLPKVLVSSSVAQKAAVADLEQRVRVKDALRDCARAYSG